MREQQEEIDLAKLFRYTLKKSPWIALFSLIIGGITALHQVFIAKEVFQSECLILPEGGQGQSAMDSRLGQLSQLVGVPSSQNESPLKLILKSRQFQLAAAEAIFEKQDPPLHSDEKVERIDRNLKLLNFEGGSLKLSWGASSAQEAKNQLEGVLKVLLKTSDQIEIQKRERKLSFLKDRVQSSKKELLEAEEKLKAFQKKHQGVSIEHQSETLLSILNDLTLQKKNAELELDIHEQLLGDQHPERKKLKLRIEKIEEHIHQLLGQKVNPEGSSAQDQLIELPSINFEQKRLMRILQLKNELYSLLSKQYELSKIDALKDYRGFEVIDPPHEPRLRISPKRTRTVITTTITAFAGAIVIFFFIGALRQKAS